jgi:hypothetical protein
MDSQKLFFAFNVPLPDFSEHPPHGFMDQVLFVGQELLCDFERF